MKNSKSIAFLLIFLSISVFSFFSFYTSTDNTSELTDSELICNCIFPAVNYVCPNEPFTLTSSCFDNNSCPFVWIGGQCSVQVDTSECSGSSGLSKVTISGTVTPNQLCKFRYTINGQTCLFGVRGLPANDESC